MPDEDKEGRNVAAIVLAAGASRRMGAVKATLATAEGPSFLALVVQRCISAAARPVVVVTGAHPLPVPPDAQEVHNSSWSSGQLSSLVAGLEALGPATRGVLVALVDHPLVRASTYGLLVRTFTDSGAAIVRPLYRGRRGHPIVLADSVTEELRSTPFEGGARPVIARWAHATLEVDVDDPGIVQDLDTPGDLERVGLEQPFLKP